MTRRRAPSGLASAGKALWRVVVDEYELRADELQTLGAAARTLDELRILEAALVDAPAVVAGSKGQDRVNPIFSEVRAHRLALRQLLASCGLDEADAVRYGTVRSAAGRRLARQRWGQAGERRGA